MAEEMTNGEIARTLNRHDEELAEKASKDALAEFKGEVREKFKRTEEIAVERRDTLAEKVRELGERIDGIGKTRTSKAANWIAAAMVAVAVIGVVVTVLVQGGR
jgi:uncharacterized membrane protein